MVTAQHLSVRPIPPPPQIKGVHSRHPYFPIIKVLTYLAGGLLGEQNDTLQGGTRVINFQRAIRHRWYVFCLCFSR